MSAPRKICVDKGSLRWLLFNEYVYQSPISTSEVYHHDDVVRELVEAARDVDQWMRGEKAYERIGYGTKLRAALAKIAQEGQP